jgi:hypothetical protein
MANDIEQRRELNKPATPQARQTMQNVILNNTPADIMTVDFSKITQNARKSVDACDAANAAKNPPEDNWRQELEELDRRLTNQLTVDEAKTYADAQESLHKSAVKAVETEIATLNDLLKTPGLSQCQPLREGREAVNRKTGQIMAGCSCDVHVFRLKLEVVTIKLQQAKIKQQQSIRVCGNIVTAAKELEAYRPRWGELRKRAKKIDDARRHIRNLKDTPLRQEHTTRGGFHLTD